MEKNTRTMAVISNLLPLNQGNLLGQILTFVSQQNALKTVADTAKNCPIELH